MLLLSCPLPALSSSLGNSFWVTSCDQYRLTSPLSHLKQKPQSLITWCVLTHTPPPPHTFISTVVFSESSGHFEMRFGRKTQCNIKLPYPHQWKECFRQPGGKPKGVWAGGEEPYKEHFVFSDVSLWLMLSPSCLLCFSLFLTSAVLSLLPLFLFW